jgi:hypothetical protein
LGSFSNYERVAVGEDELNEMGPIDYVLVEWTGK